MIKIQRKTPQEIGVEEKWVKKLKEETAAIVAHYKSQPNETFSFKAYKESGVKQGLIRLFNAKCAYCETSILHAQPGDVEHFRPKSAVDTKLDGIEGLSATIQPPPKEKEKIKPGYYWLAADWNNLLLSCNSCNRRSGQLNAAKLTTDNEDVISDQTSTDETLGKQDRFPLTDALNTKLILKPPRNLASIPNTLSELSKEKDLRLLIDPCEDDPVDHLEFIKFKVKEKVGNSEEIKEKYGMIMAKTDKGRASVQIYGLARLGLVQERQKSGLNVLNVIISMQRSLKHFKRAVKDNDEAGRKEELDFLKDRMGALKVLYEEKAEYLGLKRDMLNDLLRQDQSIAELFKILTLPPWLANLGVKLP